VTFGFGASIVLMQELPSHLQIPVHESVI